MSQRREFLRIMGLMGIGVPYLNKYVSGKQSSASHMEPMLITSWDEFWGRKILIPAWEKLQETKNILDAVEAGANVCELDPTDTSVGYGGLPNRSEERRVGK